jgi:hypothetical protein
MMRAGLLLAAALLTSTANARLPGRQHPNEGARRSALADFSCRVQVYVDIRDRACMVTPVGVSADPAEIRRASDALSMDTRTARAGARQGDIFTPAIAAVFRVAVGGCQNQCAGLLATVTEELDAPLPPARVHDRWPIGVPVPTMPPDLLAALPRLPSGLQYRFINRDLALIDIDANLIVDFVPDAIPSSTRAGTRRP